MHAFIRSAATAFVLFVAGANSSVLADPPARVGRLSLIEGDVTFHDTAAREAAPATLNWPVTGGAAISTAPAGRAEVRIGSTAIRLDGATALEFVQVDDQSIRLRLEHGAVAVRVRNREVADELVLETRDARVSLSDAGRYRIEAGRAPDTTAVTVFEGAAQADADGIAIAVKPGRRAEVGPGGRARVVEATADEFDAWTLARDRRDDDARDAPRYVSPETTGYEALDEYGDWREAPDYGPVWYPRAVPAGWAPYRAGRWAWIEPWGWTWIDEAPWGFAPFHYGRWALIGGAWGWVPGAFVARPVYAPALVGWVGRPGWSVSISIGSVPAVGWFPLAPREVFVPAYRASPVYVRKVNVTHVTNIVNVTNVVQPRYAHRHVERAVTVVPAAAVTGGQPVGRSAVRVRHAELAADDRASNAPPANAGRPPRQFGAPRRDDDGRWTRRAQPVAAAPAPQAQPAPRPQADRRPDAARPVQREPERRRDDAERRPEPRNAPERPATAPAAPVAPATAERERSLPNQAAPAANPPAPPVAAERERRRNELERRPEPRAERERPAPAQAPTATPAPPVAAERERRRNEPERRPEPRAERERPAPAQASPTVTPAPPVAAQREPRRSEPFQRAEPRAERPTPTPAPPAVAAPPAPPRVAAPPVQPRVAAPPTPRERAERREEPRPAPRVAAPAQPPPPVRASAPPQVRAPAAPAAPPQAERAPRPEASRGQPREARQGERRGG